MVYPHSEQWNQVKNTFRQIWGYEDFRPPQGEIISELLEQKDALIVMPTGGGKSICFQLPALLQNGLTLVVSPLVALMENQVQELKERNLPAALLHSELSSFQRRQTMQALDRNQLRLLYLSPETLLSEAVWSVLKKPQLLINGMILDEAHCLVQWGETFRPAYRRLGVVRSALLKFKPPGTKMAVAAFTATADPTAQQTIQRVLQLQNPQLFKINPYRSNLQLQVKIAWTPKGRKQQLFKFIKSKPKQSGLVYVRTRKDAEELAIELTQQGLKTAAYHAGLNPIERRQIEAKWLNNELQFVICTSAFGMGINKPDVRWVVHFQAPTLLSEYVQEIGRAGRDGKPAQAFTLVSEPTGWLDPGDQQRWKFFEKQGRSQSQKAEQIAKKLPIRGEFQAVVRKFPEGAVALSLLHCAGRLTWHDPFHYSIHDSSNSLMPLNLNAATQMKTYLHTRRCRWQFLLSAFGFADEAKAWQCGHCDNCRHSSFSK
jgi:ATP-dependent DNA helicase RecQ